MALSLAALVCLGLCLGQVMPASKGPLSRPTLIALPSTLVPMNKPVTLRCQAPLGMAVYRLEKVGSATYQDNPKLHIPAMNSHHAGQYRCSYQDGTHWSPASELLNLVATDVYPKPVLSALPSLTVPWGSDVTLRCQSHYNFDQFALYKEGTVWPPKKPEEHWYRADFPLATVNAKQGGTYRCYSFSSSTPYLWSAPSDPLKLVIKTVISKPHNQEPIEVATPGSTPAPSQTPNLTKASAPELQEIIHALNFSVVKRTSRNESTRRKGTKAPRRPPTTPDLPPEHYTKSNVVRLCLGAAVLVLLCGILVEDWHSRRKVLSPLPRVPKA